MLGRLVDVYGRIGRLEDGIELSQQILGFAPHSQQVHRWLAEAYTLIQQSTAASYHRKLADKLTPRPK